MSENYENVLAWIFFVVLCNFSKITRGVSNVHARKHYLMNHSQLQKSIHVTNVWHIWKHIRKTIILSRCVDRQHCMTL